MTGGSQSRNHHWWPVGLQSYWADKAGDVSWVKPDGKVEKKRAANRKIGLKIHGHTIFRGSDWESNFESEFDIDNDVHAIISALQDLKPFGRNISEFFTLFYRYFKKKRSIKDMCKLYHLEEINHRKILLLLCSLLIRSPASRSRYEDYPKIFGLPSDEDTGKANMVQNYRIAKRLCQRGPILNQYFVILHSPLKKFVFGDGSLDWLTSGLVANRISGKALITLTPHLCVYFCTPTLMRTSSNCASLSVAPWMVDWVNEITQIYSRDKIFFSGKVPKLTDAFRQGQFLEHKKKTDALIDMLDEISGFEKSRNLFTAEMSGFI